MHAFDVLGDPVRRRLPEPLDDGGRSSGEPTGIVRDEPGTSRPAVSQHLRVRGENGFATVREDGSRRLYAVDTGPPRDADARLRRFAARWEPHLAALDTELAGGRRERRSGDRAGPGREP
ncbi:ArsR/SmtB family transcription factor [Nocardiopsis sp. CA-288880]|uniref:ArsR/SmtB family transcription factor n=1 Tax=Nocardiopsis sp. CA-288880 TaxID=3239995 RepID=UPI003D967788